MIRISSRVEYGLRALVDLAQHYGPTPVLSSDIATRQGIPESYLQQLLLVLRRAGLVRSFRGPQGGHRLARLPERISLADAVRALEGSLVAKRGSARAAGADQPVEAEILGEVWSQLEEALGDMLASISLEDLCQRKLAREEQVMYYI